MSKKNRILAKAAILGGLLIATSQASAIQITTPTPASPIEDIPGITTFQTHGDDMAGLMVTATFLGGATETIAWSAYGAGAGGVAGTNWSLSETNDTFTSPWAFLNNTGVALTSLVLDASHATGGGYVVFDRTTSGSEGTTNSAQGKDITSTVGGWATYSVQVGVGGAGPVGDLWHILTMDFSSIVDQAGGVVGLADARWTFIQDTDNDIRHTVPEPASIALLAFGFIGLGFMRRHSRC